MHTFFTLMQDDTFRLLKSELTGPLNQIRQFLAHDTTQKVSEDAPIRFRIGTKRLLDQVGQLVSVSSSFILSIWHFFLPSFIFSVTISAPSFLSDTHSDLEDCSCNNIKRWSCNKVSHEFNTGAVGWNPLRYWRNGLDWQVIYALSGSCTLRITYRKCTHL